MKQFIRVIILIATAAPGWSQSAGTSTEEIRVGLLTTYDQRYLNASFAQLPTVPTCCQSFTNEEHNGFTIGALAEFPLSMGLSPSIRLLYTQMGGEFTSTEQKYVYDGSLASAEASFLHTIDARVHALVIEPGARINLDWGLSVGLGVQLAYLVDATFEQREQITSPNTIHYLGGTRERNLQSGDLPRVNSWQVGLNLGLGYDFKIPDVPELTIGPEVNYTYNFSNIIDGINWKTHILRGGVVAKWTISTSSTTAP